MSNLYHHKSDYCSQFHDPKDAVEDSSHDDSDPEPSDEDFGFVLDQATNTRGKLRHPPAEKVSELWQIYLDRVDPLTRILHIATVDTAIRKALTNMAKIPKGFEALMFAIYSTAAMSLTDDECLRRFQEPRAVLLSRYVAATKAALSKANFMATINLVVLQALLLHLFSVRDGCDPRTVHSLNGIAVRIAQCMGVDRDGSLLGLTPFEVEIRRRIWWSLKTHDFRTAELCGLAKFRDIDVGPEATKWPTNVNDDELHPGMPSAPVESGSMTDFVFCALRYELTKLAAGRVAKFREQGKSHSQWDLRSSGADKDEIEAACKELEEHIETRYLRYCDPSQPLHLLTMVLARSAMNNIAFLTHHPRKWGSIQQTPPEEQELVWNISVKHLEQHHMVQTNPQLTRFAWHSAYFLQWHSFIHVLDTLRAVPFVRNSERVWELVSKTYANNPDLVTDTRKPINVAVGNLCLKAYGAREKALRDKKADVPAPPAYISQLRQQRELAKAKREARNAENDQSEGLRRLQMVDTSGLLSTSVLDNAQSGDSILHNLQPQMHMTEQAINSPGFDTFWFQNGLTDMGQVNNFEDVMNIDPEFIMSPQPDIGGNPAEPISWAQWDAWLAESNIIPPLQHM